MRGPAPTEHQEQVALIDWWRLAHRSVALPEFALFAVPNGGLRSPRTAARLKAEGVRAGVPDLVLAVSRGTFHGAYIELKRLRGSSVRENQVTFGKYLADASYAYCVARGWVEARDFIRGYLALSA